MANLVAQSQLDMGLFLTNASLNGLFDSGDVITHTEATFLIKDTADTQEELTLNGTLGYTGGTPYPDTGTITGGAYRPGNTGLPAFDFSGVSISVESFRDYVFADDVTGLFDYMFAGNDHIIGSAFSDALWGFDGNDVIDGRGGNDALFGGLGNDRYIVRSSSDQVFEDFNAGTADRVDASFSYILPANVERLVLTGTADLKGTGNDLANQLTGNAGANVLDGLAGADTMTGGAGNDTYIVDRSSDRVVELADGGTDRVNASATFTLSANVEKLTLTGTENIRGTGNASDNAITGNSGANVLSGLGGVDTLNGGGGNDQLIGGDGNDKLTGGAGADKFVFNSALATAGVDKILDFSVADDSIVLDQTIFRTVGAPGTLTNAAFFAGTSAQDPYDRVIYDSATGKIFYDADGNGAGHQVLIAQVTAGLVLTKADFIIVG